MALFIANPRTLSQFTLYFFIIIHLCLADTTSIVNRVAEYAGTPVATNPKGIPTLIYNCAKLPSICRNVGTRNPIGNDGKLLGVDHIELNYDTEESRKIGRRNEQCPRNWRATHVCPEPNQPRVVPQGAYLDVLGVGGSFVGQRANPALAQADAGSYVIADSTGVQRGMAWTCDEWPPAQYSLPISMFSDAANKDKCC